MNERMNTREKEEHELSWGNAVSKRPTYINQYLGALDSSRILEIHFT